jgi:large subunit ribosomal protein L29
LKAKDLHELDNDQLVQRLADTRQELFNLRFQSAAGALEDTTRLKLAKREIARILTLQNERGLNVAGVEGR